VLRPAARMRASCTLLYTDSAVVVVEQEVL